MRKTKKIITGVLIIGALTSTTASALSFSSYGIGTAFMQRCAYTGANDAVYASASISYNKSVKTAVAGDEEGTTLRSLWIQTGYIIGASGTATGYHEAEDTTRGITVFSSY